MKVFTFLFVTFLTFTPIASSTADADGRCTGFGCKHDYASRGTAFDVAREYAMGGTFGGVTSGTTGTTLDIAQDSMSLLGSLDQIASTWPVPPILAKGN
jgi:hypothetical protein